MGNADATSDASVEDAESTIVTIDAGHASPGQPAATAGPTA